MEAEDFSAQALADRLDATAIPPLRAYGELTLKERFRKTMFFQEIEVLPNFEFGYWERTLESWHKQGLPDWVVDETTAYEYFGIESWVTVPVNVGLTPLYEHTVLEEDDDRVIYRDTNGCIAQINKKGHKSIPHFLEFPVKDRKTWEPYKAALDPDDPQRYAELDGALKRLRDSDRPVGVPGGSLVGIPRNLIGFERIAVLPYEDPELFQGIVESFGRCICAVLEWVLPKIAVDFCMGWEDICFNQGPIISPEVFRHVAGPWYRRIADLLVLHGCCIYTTDTDGNIVPVVDAFLESGLNTMFPVEVHAGSDPRLLRERYGKRIRLWGGVDKMVLRESREAILAELMRLKPYVEQGGFIPGVDHRVPADVPLDLYKFYLDKKRCSLLRNAERGLYRPKTKTATSRRGLKR